jgi:hypothetical protein
MKKTIVGILLLLSCVQARSTMIPHNEMILDCEGLHDAFKIGNALVQVGTIAHQHVDTMVGHAMADKIILQGKAIVSRVVELEYKDGTCRQL